MRIWTDSRMISERSLNQQSPRTQLEVNDEGREDGVKTDFRLLF